MPTTIEIFPAKSGDCILVNCNEAMFLIDCGNISTYKQYLKPRLQELGKQGKTIKRLIITHIDDDHIVGIIKFLEENGPYENPQIIKVEQVWHNSYRHLQHEKVVLAELNEKAIDFIKEIRPPSTNSCIERTQISANQGSSLGSLILNNGYPWNTDFDQNAICVDSKSSIQINEDIMVHLLSPNFESLSKLERYWCKELYKLGYRDVITKNEIFDDAFEFLLRNEKKKLDARVEKISNSSLSVPELLKTEFVEDLSITNRSSIAFILETHNSKMLFLGDSAVSLVEPSLKKYNSNQAQILHFDFIMVSHHGSRNNTNSDLLAAIDATNFCISTDGQKHEHPDLETLALIVSRNTPTKRKLFFNYRTDSSNAFNTKEIMEQYKYDVLYPKDEILTIQVD